MIMLPAKNAYRSAIADYPSRPVPEQPTVSIVVPVYNEIANVDRLLQELLSQDYPAISEIWMVDGQSNDGTLEALRRQKLRAPQIEVIENPRRSPAAAVNLGVARAQSDVVLRLDAHAQYESDVVSRSIEALLATDAGGVGAIARTAKSKTTLGRAIVAAHQSPFGVGVAAFRREGAQGWVDSIWNGCYWRHVMQRVGPLREDLWRAEDNDFNARVRGLGYGLYLSPEIRAYYHPRDSLSGLWKQYMSNGVGVAAALFKNPRAVSLRHLAPLALVIGLFAPLALALAWPAAAIASAVTALAYAAALLAATLLAARTDPGAHLLLLPAVLVTLHLSYGFGLLWGIFLVMRSYVKA